MKKIAIFLSILFYIISSQKINVFNKKSIELLMTKKTHQDIILEVKLVASNV